MSAQPQWITAAGSLGTIPEGVFYSTPLIAVDPLAEDQVYFALIAGQLPSGVQIQQTGILAGVPLAVANIQGVPAEVSRDVTSRFAVRAYTQKTVNGVIVVNRLADRTFELTVTGQDAPEFTSPAGQLAQYYDGSVVTGFQVGYTDVDPDQTVVIRLVAGQLPPGLSISRTGLISGFIPVTSLTEGTGGWSADGEAWDEYPWSFSTQADSTNYEFVLEATDGVSAALRTFSIFVWARSTMTADNTDITADNTFITADATPIRPPIILNTTGTIGTVRNDNFFAYQFNGVDLDNNPFTIFPIITIGTVPNVNVNPPSNPQTVLNALFPAAVAGSGVLDDTLDELWVYNGAVWDNFGSVPLGYTSALPPGLTLDPVSGWLYGLIPDTGISTNTYDFSLLIKKTADANIFSGPYNYSLTVTGPINSEITWLTPNDPVELARVPSSLGTIVNGSVSTLYVRAVNAGGLKLQYELDLGTAAEPQYNLLPQGLELLLSGDIAGRCSFNTFALDGGITTFDVTRQNGADPTTFDLVRVFTVRAFSVDGVVNVTKTFSITVIREYNQPYENLYIQCMPPQDDRDLINNLLQNSDIFPQDLLYRPDDANFGVATRVVYNHAYGLTAATIEEYYASLTQNHYWKNLVLGEIKTAQARDATGQVIYEVVYSQVVDDLVNRQGESVSKTVQLPFAIDYGDDLVNVTSVTPNSLINMRDQVIDTVGQVSNILPAWMISQQQNGRVLGFVPSWVIAYTQPGRAEQIAYNIRTQFDQPLNLIDFEVDRYELDRLLTKNWDPELNSWVTIPDLPTVIIGSVPDANVTPPGNPQITLSNAFPNAIIGDVVFDGNPTENEILTSRYWVLGPIVNQIQNITATLDTLEITLTTANSIFKVGQSITISGVVPAGFNGTYVITGFSGNLLMVLGSFSQPYQYGGTIVGTKWYNSPSLTTFDGSGDPADWTNNLLQPVQWVNDENIAIIWVSGGETGEPTIFDQNSMQFTAPVDMYSSTQIYDKYLVFTKRNILE